MANSKAFNEAVFNLRKAQTRIRKFEEKHERVFIRHAEIQENIDGAMMVLKEEARKVAPSGQDKKTLLAEDDLTVSVQAKLKAVTYSVRKARRLWPEEVYKHCRTSYIDPVKLAEHIEDGSIDEEVVGKAEDERIQTTAAVTVKVRK